MGRKYPQTTNLIGLENCDPKCYRLLLIFLVFPEIIDFRWYLQMGELSAAPGHAAHADGLPQRRRRPDRARRAVAARAGE